MYPAVQLQKVAIVVIIIKIKILAEVNAVGMIVILDLCIEYVCIFMVGGELKNKGVVKWVD